MTAKGEEIGVDIVHLAAQQLAEGGGDKSFHAGLRRPAAALAAEGRQRQRFTVQFAVGAQRSSASCISTTGTICGGSCSASRAFSAAVSSGRPESETR